MTAALRAEFHRCRPWIERAIAIDGETTAEAVLCDLLEGRAQLWPSDNACVVTQCVISPEGPLIHAWLGGGKLGEMIQLRAGIEAYGRAMGCQFATIEGRRGWDRLYRSYGYALEGGVLRKRL